MQVAIVSDTHVPSRATQIPDAFRERIRDADHVVHAGDFDAEGTVADVRETAAELTAVAGNTDPRVGLPSVASVRLDGVEFVVTHGTGSKRGYEDRVADVVRRHGDGRSAQSPGNQGDDDADRPVGVSGHTHEVMDRSHGGVRLLNPGSATGAPPASRATMLTAEVSAGSLDVTLHEL